MQYTDEFYAVVSQTADILSLAEKYVRKKAPYLATDYIRTKIMEREKIGNTYVGGQTIVLHVISSKVTQNYVMYLFFLRLKKWFSRYSNRSYQVNKVMIVVVNPKHVDLRLKFFPKFFDCAPAKIAQNFDAEEDKVYQFL